MARSQVLDNHRSAIAKMPLPERHALCIAGFQFQSGAPSEQRADFSSQQMDVPLSHQSHMLTLNGCKLITQSLFAPFEKPWATLQQI